jgi:cytochrome c oxidase subunit 2
VFVLVETIVIYSVWKFRARPGDELRDGPPIHGNTRLEIIWTAIPAIVLVALCSYAYVTLRQIEEAKADTMRVRVVGEQFTWSFYYPGDGGKEYRSPELYLPTNQPVHFTVQSKDVIHDFFVPAFRLKIDAVPGIDTSYRITTTGRTGVFPVVCAELCGLGHSVMRQSAHVVSPDDYDKWLSDLRSGKQPGGGGGGGGGGAAGGAADGKTLFTTAAQPAACGSCHTLADAGTTATVGPNLDDVLKGKDKDFIRQSIQEPDAEIAPGFSPGIMPNFGDSLDPKQIDALVNYLSDVTSK